MKKADVKTQAALAALLLATSGISFADSAGIGGVSIVHKVSHAIAVSEQYAPSSPPVSGYKWGGTQDPTSNGNVNSSWASQSYSSDGYKWDDAHKDSDRSKLTQP
ncbi:hypothetical protein N9M39_01355, partial [Halieaceae bacterium]|nr:hypothetical protein [Halieaceae bacterium]MDA8752785.1 hypothetical protein [Halieaceae bacterium]